MSGKLLSFIVPTYNMAKLLPQCIDSFVNSKYVDELDVVVVNDGSKDESLSVAQSYAERYPNVVRVIDKPNGNYGSTINSALQLFRDTHLYGSYVKIVDSDDKVDTSALNKMIEALHEIEEKNDVKGTSTKTDMVITHFTQLWRGGTREVVRYNTMGKEPYTYGKVYDLDSVLKDGYIRFFLMHALTYRTELLFEIQYHQTEGISYTDTEWSCIPVFHAKNILFLDINLYQYNLDREGQTMAPEVILKSIPQMEKVNDSLIEYYVAHKDNLSVERTKFMRQYFENRVRLFYKLYLLDMPRDDFNPEELKRFDGKITPVCEKLGLYPRLYPENKILRVEYISYWRKHQKRWPVWFEKFNHCVDVVVKWLYVRIFRS